MPGSAGCRSRTRGPGTPQSRKSRAPVGPGLGPLILPLRPQLPPPPAPAVTPTSLSGRGSLPDHPPREGARPGRSWTPSGPGTPLSRTPRHSFHPPRVAGSDARECVTVAQAGNADAHTLRPASDTGGNPGVVGRRGAAEMDGRSLLVAGPGPGRLSPGAAAIAGIRASSRSRRGPSRRHSAGPGPVWTGPAERRPLRLSLRPSLQVLMSPESRGHPSQPSIIRVSHLLSESSVYHPSHPSVIRVDHRGA